MTEEEVKEKGNVEGGWLIEVLADPAEGEKGLGLDLIKIHCIYEIVNG